MKNMFMFIFDLFWSQLSFSDLLIASLSPYMGDAVTMLFSAYFFQSISLKNSLSTVIE